MLAHFEFRGVREAETSRMFCGTARRVNWY